MRSNRLTGEDGERANNPLLFIMKFVKVYPENGEPYWKDGKEPTTKEIGVASFVGWERADYVRDYEARPDKHPTGEDNIKYCELKTQTSRDDVSDYYRGRKHQKRFF